MASSHRSSEVVRRLAAAGCIAAEEEAEELVADAPDAAELEQRVRRREAGEPLAWITGAVVFCGRRVGIDPGVYVPRPQSEELARRAAVLLGQGGGWAADLCTGSGAVALHMAAEVPRANVVGVDVDARAVACARRNAVRAVRGDIGAPLGAAAFDVVTAVAPYVPTADLALLPSDVQRYEPRRALDGGGDGLDVVRAVVGAGARILRRGGWLLVELGGDEDDALAPTLAEHGFDAASTWSDDEGDLRGLGAQLSRAGE